MIYFLQMKFFIVEALQRLLQLEKLILIALEMVPQEK